jgi:hypothetical protein
MKSKEALPITGTLFAMYHFDVYSNKGRKKTYLLEGNATSSNCSYYRNQMMRNSFLDAKYRLFNIIGSAYQKFNAKLIDFFFIYLTEKTKGKRGKTETIQHYNQEIPDSERNYKSISIRTTENKPIIRTYKQTSLFDNKKRVKTRKKNNKTSQKFKPRSKYTTKQEKTNKKHIVTDTKHKKVKKKLRIS